MGIATALGWGLHMDDRPIRCARERGRDVEGHSPRDTACTDIDVITPMPCAHRGKPVNQRTRSTTACASFSTIHNPSYYCYRITDRFAGVVGKARNSEVPM